MKGHEADDDDRRGRPAAETRLESLDQRIQRDRQEHRGQDPHEDVAHAPREVADERQEQQTGHDVATAAAVTSIETRRRGGVGASDAPAPVVGAVRRGRSSVSRSVIPPLCPIRRETNLPGVSARELRRARTDRRSGRQPVPGVALADVARGVLAAPRALAAVVDRLEDRLGQRLLVVGRHEPAVRLARRRR